MHEDLEPNTYEAYTERFKAHYEETYANTDQAYADYEPAYRYGYELATQEEYQECDWSEVEADVREGWQEEGEGPWETFKGAVQLGWNEVQRAVR